MASSLTAELRLELGKFRQGLRKARSDAGKGWGRVGGSGAKVLGASFVGVFSRIIKVGIVAAVVAAIAAAAIAIRKGMQIIGASVAEAAKTERYLMRFEVLSGDRDIAMQMFADLRAEALRTGIAVQDMADNTAKFMAFGFDKDKAAALNRGILDVGGAVGLTTRDMKLLGVALSQVAAKGVANMEELRQQIAEKGIPIFDALEAKLGVGGQALSKMIQEGQVSADTVIDMFIDLDGSFARFKGGAEKMAGTFEGQTNIMHRGWEEFLRVMGEPIRDALRPLLTEGIKLVTKLTEKAAGIGEKIAKGIDYVIASFRVLAGMDFSGIASLFGSALELAAVSWFNLMVKFSRAFYDIFTDSSMLTGFAKTMFSIASYFVEEIANGLEKVRLGTKLGKAIEDGVTGIGAAFWSSSMGRGLASGDPFNPISKEEMNKRLYDEIRFKNQERENEILRRRGDLGGDGANIADKIKAAMASGDVFKVSGKSQGHLDKFSAKLQEQLDELKKMRADLNKRGGKGVHDTLADFVPQAGGGGFGLAGSISQQVSTIAGRNANQLIAAEAMKSNTKLDKANDTLDAIKKNTTPHNNPAPFNPAVPMPNTRFA